MPSCWRLVFLSLISERFRRTNLASLKRSDKYGCARSCYQRIFQVGTVIGTLRPARPQRVFCRCVVRDKHSPHSVSVCET